MSVLRESVDWDHLGVGEGSARESRPADSSHTLGCIVSWVDTWAGQPGRWTVKEIILEENDERFIPQRFFKKIYMRKLFWKEFLKQILQLYGAGFKIRFELMILQHVQLEVVKFWTYFEAFSNNISQNFNFLGACSSQCVLTNLIFFNQDCCFDRRNPSMWEIKICVDVQIALESWIRIRFWCLYR